MLGLADGLAATFVLRRVDDRGSKPPPAEDVTFADTLTMTTLAMLAALAMGLIAAASGGLSLSFNP